MRFRVNREDRRPNILLITCDQLRSDYLGCYGADFMQTPHIDALAAEGRVYENAYSPNPVCIPARMGLLTGLGCRHHQFYDNRWAPDAPPLSYKLPTFPQILSDSGYDTCAVGKMHFQPERRASGFDHFFAMEEGPSSREADSYLQFLKEQGYGRVQSFHGVRHCLYMQPQRSLLPEALHGSHWVADRSIQYLDEQRGRRPFLLWTSFIHPHPPFDAPDEWAEMYAGKLPAPAVPKTPLGLLAEENKTLGDLADDASLQRMRELYAACVSYCDHQVGRIVEKLKELELYDDTLILFTSDHGEMLGDLGTYQKFLPYDASCKVPFVLRWPQRVGAGERDPRFVDLYDILPTFLDAAGAAYPDVYDLPGESVFGEGVKDRRYQYAEHQQGSKRWCMLRDERYKYVYSYGDDEQLFDMVADPQETENLLCGGGTPEMRAVADRLRQRLIRYEARYGLKGGIVNGDFEKRPRYQPILYWEENFPPFVRSLVREGEREELDDMLDEVLWAIQKEPTSKPAQTHARDILLRAGYAEERVDALMERAKAQGNG
ncbi:sulfatase family protein [Bittarella massiliensis (ex Durand et al. 2017)]|uniref:Sulfatase-like hydrolase/transferase n=1 Tax=Bittarella massiliensis (ex Durand et al. 2017) TaxID=1720313 RepID=A0AAW5KAA5_9FIRM|nr:sulfatase-like hydrolase/transferase [Bittarella massiliensis (ex Durand et al. 2017)]MCQ4948295.1 sulfatase-like hydrolase/transferase [Bittarella massiliensis (ex Durand et al. 2017)]